MFLFIRYNDNKVNITRRKIGLNNRRNSRNREKELYLRKIVYIILVLLILNEENKNRAEQSFQLLILLLSI